LLLFTAPAAAVTHTGGPDQFGGTFDPRNAPYGGFGGGTCTAVKTPIVFLHGNGDEAKNWDYPPSTGVASVYDEFRNAGYNDCELFGLTWLSDAERAAPQNNYHTAATAAMVRDFIQDVKTYTGKSQVDIIAHSMGVTVGIHGLDYGGLWGSARKMIAIAGAVRGLSSCWWMGYANPAAPTCGSQNVFSSNIFGFFPHLYPAYNPKMGDGGYRDKPSGKATQLYTIRAGYNDQITCSTASYYTGCGDTSKFDAYTNVKAQLNVGRGATAAQYDYDFADWSIYNTGGGDSNGVGHFRAKNNTGVIQRNMITGSCTGTGCCSGYGYTCQ
jgi:pimeloyl-ACP methyl ester carboxylesterase